MANTSLSFDQFMIHQLNNNFIGKPVQIQGLIVVDIHDFNPKEFFPPPDATNSHQIKECYVLTSRRPLFVGHHTRKTGYWKEVGYLDGKIYCSDGLVGLKQTLCFYEGGMQNGKKTNWKMTEYSVQQHFCSSACDHNHMRMDNLVLCKVYEDLKPDTLCSKVKEMSI